MIKAESISYQLPGKYLVKPVSISLHAGEMAVIMGANGAGKSTLLKLLTGALKPSSGKIVYKGKDLSVYTSEELATERAVLSQSYQLNFPITVADIIMMGRYPYFGAAPTLHDQAIFDATVNTLGVKHLLDRDYNTLSGGEAQKVQMARVLAQVWQYKDDSPKALFLDEPVSSLDMKFQHEILSIAKRFAQAGNAVITVLHDVNLALQYADCIYFMKEGDMQYTYKSGQRIDLNILCNIFDVKFERIETMTQRQFLVAGM
jgi:iron complex transport system ATP-binding protein